MSGSDFFIRMLRGRHAAVCWLLAAGYAFLAIAGHGGLHALTGDGHHHCHGLGHGHHAHVHGSGSGHASHCHQHSGDAHDGGAPHDGPPDAGPCESSPAAPPAPRPVEHDDNCLICVVLSSPVEVTVSVVYEPHQLAVGERTIDSARRPTVARPATPPARGPPLV